MSQPCHAFAGPRRHRRSQEDMKKIQFEYRRTHADSTGHELRRVRDREAPGSNPGPPTILYSRSAISGVVRSRRGTAGAQIRQELAGLARPKVSADRRLNSLKAIAKPIYQHAHGPRTVRP